MNESKDITRFFDEVMGLEIVERESGLFTCTHLKRRAKPHTIVEFLRLGLVRWLPPTRGVVARDKQVLLCKACALEFGRRQAGAAEQIEDEILPTLVDLGFEGKMVVTHAPKYRLVYYDRPRRAH